MRVKNIVYEDFVNYKKPSMFIGTISCNGKCCIEAGIPLSVCQNDACRTQETLDISNDGICALYLENKVSEAIVFGGLEPFEQFNELYWFINMLRYKYGCNDDVVIYTGYYPDEIVEEIYMLSSFPNIIVKFGRYIPNDTPRYDEVLGVTLASSNQYAQKISRNDA